ncbi:XkdF-like putative serine protease domain-containing protein [Methanobrevibacter filiformis]|uniref:Phage-like element PBSX protein XkdF domain-containing protein n=1 Tax=Methanobrevibacter filiformis TaxID=55758 RepID=A0A166FAB3_9EURY|nr:XkdF-like putative serine protease domain-containing protein [Methanobrevibacter filiformis]KZX17463.1 hypothetical protein MBFIL_01210 [Methanobrevibacter filiformis]
MTKSKIVYKNNKQKLITAPVLIPDYADCDAPRGEKKLTIEEIQDFSHKYMEKYRISDKQHDYFQTKKEVAIPVESWTLKSDTEMDNGETYPKGT